MNPIAEQFKVQDFDAIRLKLLEQVKEFRDAWPWSPGAKPDDPDDATAARNAEQALPSFETLSRLKPIFLPRRRPG